MTPFQQHLELHIFQLELTENIPFRSSYRVPDLQLQTLIFQVVVFPFLWLFTFSFTLLPEFLSPTCYPSTLF